jgi:hypothetical protein
VIVNKGRVLELPPGPITIAVSAAEYHSIKEEILMEGGDHELSYELMPLNTENLRIIFPGPNSKVYSGAMYMGGNPAPKQEEVIEEVNFDDTEETEMPDEEITETETAIIAETETEETEAAIAVKNEDVDVETETDDIIISEDGDDEDADTMAEESTEEDIQLTQETRAGFFPIYVPFGQFQYIRVETEDGLTGEAIVKGNPDAKDVRIITLKPRRLPGRDDNPVEKSRKKFYGAYGRFWLALPLAFIINGISQSYADNYNSSGNPNMYNSVTYSNYISIGAWAISGVFLAETLIRMFVYVRTGTKESIPYIE